MEETTQEPILAVRSCPSSSMAHSSDAKAIRPQGFPTNKPLQWHQASARRWAFLLHRDLWEAQLHFTPNGISNERELLEEMCPWYKKRKSYFISYFIRFRRLTFLHIISVLITTIKRQFWSYDSYDISKSKTKIIRYAISL